MPEDTQLTNPSHKDSLSDFLTQEYDTIATSLLADVSLYCNNAEFKAHRIVLSHYSSFFRSIFESVSTSKHFDVYLEGFQEPEIECVLKFCYTGKWWGGGGRDQIRDVAVALQIPSLTSFLAEHHPDPTDNNNKPPASPHDSSSSPVSIWQKCEGDLILHEEDEEQLEFGSEEEDECFYGFEQACKRKQEPSDSVSKRRKQARPKRHKPTPPNSRSQSPDEVSCTDDEDFTPPGSYDDEDIQSPTLSSQDPTPSPKPVTPNQPPNFPIPLPPQDHTAHLPPPHFHFLRNMIHQPHLPPPHPGPQPPPPPHFWQPQQVGKKLGITPKTGLWGKLMGKQTSGVFHHHGTSRAQHSAPRGGPPRAWSNQDLTEALHNVWNKKMTTSQASRIFGIPYNSLLMYVRGKYGKSLKLDLLKKGLDLALLEKQQQQQKLKAHGSTSGQQNGGSTGSSTSSSRELGASVSPGGPPRNNNVVEWMMMNSGNGKQVMERGTPQGIFQAGMFYGGGGAQGRKIEEALFRKQEIGK